MTKWDEDTTYKFVKMYREYQCLWDFKNNEYRNRGIRDEALKDIVARMNIDGFNLQEAKIKIKNLRSTYAQERVKIERTREMPQTYTPRIKWYPIMDSFYKKKNKKKVHNDSNLNNDSVESPEIIEDMSQSDDSKNEITIDEESWIPKQPKREKSPIESISEINTPMRFHSPINRTENSNNSKQLKIFGRSVTAQLKMLTPEQAILASDEIQSVLTKYRLENLRQTKRE